MSPAFTTRRRADEFDALVTGRSSGRSTVPGGLVELAELVAQLRDLTPVAPRPEFSSALRERLMTEADTALAKLDPAAAPLTLPARRAARDRRIATVIGGAALLGATTSMAVAAQSALPGDSLYPVKRALEDAETGLAGDAAERGQALLDNATGRLAEVNALALRGTDEGLAAVPATLVEFTDQSLEGSTILLDTFVETGDRSVITQLRDFTHDSMQELLGLDAELPDSARDELVDAARALTQIDDRARDLCPSCDGAGIAEVPPFLLTTASLPTAGMTQVGVPPAMTTPRRSSDTSSPELSTSGEATPAPLVLPDVEQHLGDTDPPAGHVEDEERPRGGGSEGGSKNPVGELTKTLTKQESTSVTEPVDPTLLDDLGDTVADTVDPLLD